MCTEKKQEVFWYIVDAPMIGLKYFVSTLVIIWSKLKPFPITSIIVICFAIYTQYVTSLVSEGWGSRVSDKILIANYGLQSLVHTVEMILADPGFIVQKYVGLYCDEVKVPYFTKENKHLSWAEINTAQQLYHLIIHVERQCLI